MAYDDYLKRAVAGGFAYEELPARVRDAVPLDAWRRRVKDASIQKGRPYGEAVSALVSEVQYYEELLKAYRGWQRCVQFVAAWRALHSLL